MDIHCLRISIAECPCMDTRAWISIWIFMLVWIIEDTSKNHRYPCWYPWIFVNPCMDLLWILGPGNRNYPLEILSLRDQNIHPNGFYSVWKVFSVLPQLCKNESACFLSFLREKISLLSRFYFAPPPPILHNLYSKIVLFLFDCEWHLRAISLSEVLYEKRQT